MRKLIVTALVLIVSLFCARAQQDASAVLAEIQASGAALKSFECDFVQSSGSPMMKEPMLSKGRMFYKAPSCVRWEYTEPKGTAMVINGGRAMMSADGKSHVVDLSAQKGFAQMSGLMTGLVQGSMLRDGSFACDVEVSARTYTVTLTPLAKALKKMLSEIVMVYDRAGACVSELRMSGKGGESQTVIKLMNMNKDVALGDDVFKVE